MTAREAILNKVRASLGAGDEARRYAVQARLAGAPQGVIPARGQIADEARVALFMEMAARVAASVERVDRAEQVPAAIAAMLRARNLPAGFRMGDDARLEAMPWSGEPALTILRGPSDGDDEIGVSHAFGGVAETGTLVLVSGKDNPTTINFLPETHLVVIDARDIAGDLESVIGRVRILFGKGAMPRTVNLITGPSRSGDIEQKIVLGAHGPRALHLIVVGGHMTVKLGDAKLPEGLRIYAIGDVHGRLDLLRRMHAMIADDLTARPVKAHRILHIGDYVDRGPDARGVIDFLVEKKSDDNLICLCGNHDLRFLDFMEDGEDWEQFRDFGGAETARSYGVELDFGSQDNVESGRVALDEAVPESHKDFLATLPLSFAAGDFFFCHAGIRPGVPLDKQEEGDLLWIRDEFTGSDALHPKVIVHGHTPHEGVELRPNRIDIDTHAFKSGRLTAIAIEGIDVRIMEAAA